MCSQQAHKQRNTGRKFALTAQVVLIMFLGDLFQLRSQGRFGQKCVSRPKNVCALGRGLFCLAGDLAKHPCFTSDLCHQLPTP